MLIRRKAPSVLKITEILFSFKNQKLILQYIYRNLFLQIIWLRVIIMIKSKERLPEHMDMVLNYHHHSQLKALLKLLTGINIINKHFKTIFLKLIHHQFKQYHKMIMMNMLKLHFIQIIRDLDIQIWQMICIKYSNKEYLKHQLQQVKNLMYILIMKKYHLMILKDFVNCLLTMINLWHMRVQMMIGNMRLH
jgi:hypothetical protein